MHENPPKYEANVSKQSHKQKSFVVEWGEQMMWRGNEWSAMYEVLHCTITERVMTWIFAKRYEVSQMKEGKIRANSMHGIDTYKVLVRKISVETTLHRCKCRLVFYGM